MQRTTLLLAVFASVLVLGPSLGTVRAQDDDLRAKKETAARKLMEVSSEDGFAKQTMGRILATFEQAPSGVSAEFIAKFKEMADIEELADLTVKIYVERLDLEEMEAAIEFYESPMGKRYLRKRAAMTQETLRVTEQWAREKTPEIVAALEEADLPSLPEREGRLTCRQNLNYLGKSYLIWRMEHRGSPQYTGSAFFLSLRKKREILKGDESKLICPGDQCVIRPNTPDQQDRYDDVDLQDIPSDMCSYAMRDFERYPLDPSATTLQIIACDRMGTNGRTSHHKDGLNILFDNISTQFMSREDLGIGPAALIIVGPDSPHPMLKKVIAIPAK